MAKQNIRVQWRYGGGKEILMTHFDQRCPDQKPIYDHDEGHTYKYANHIHIFVYFSVGHVLACLSVVSLAVSSPFA